MKSATFALVLAFCILGMLVLGSSFGFDKGILARFAPGQEEGMEAAIQPEQAAATGKAQPRQTMETPAGFRGPTGQPSVRGPVGPPPEE